jgi:hypothetical protein
VLPAHAGGLGEHRLVVIDQGYRIRVPGIRWFWWCGNTVVRGLLRRRTAAGRTLRRALRWAGPLSG